MAKTATCLWCGEEITKIGGPIGEGTSWYHAYEDGPDRYTFCYCHCAECDPKNGYTDGRECIDGEEAKPDLLTIREVNRG